MGVHLAPRCDAHDMGDDDPLATFSYVARELGKRGIAFIFTREHRDLPSLSLALKKAFGGPLIANEKLNKERATALLEAGEADAVSFGKLYISNPDLVERFRQDTELNRWDSQTFYGSTAEGYTDYPALSVAVLE